MSRAPVTIEAAALRLPTGLVLTLPTPAQHVEIIRSAWQLGLPAEMITTAQAGYLNSFGGFVSCATAAEIAALAG